MVRHWSFQQESSELQLADELHVPRAAIAEIWIGRIRRAGQPEPRTEGRRGIGKIWMIPHVEELGAQAQHPVAADGLRFDQRHIEIIQPRPAERISSQIAVSPRLGLRECRWIQVGAGRIKGHMSVSDQIRTIAKFARAGIIKWQTDVERAAGLQGRDSIQ